MQRKAVLISAALFALSWVFAFPLFAQPPAAPRTGVIEVSDLLRRGEELETQRRWADAMVHYEEAVRQFPDDHSLERHFTAARLHYDLGRRYADTTFCQSIKRLSLQETLSLYEDVLVKIQAHYVEALPWKALVEHGLNSLDVALGEPAFLDRNAPQANATAVDAFRREVRRSLGEQMVASRDDARNAAATAAEMARTRLAAEPTAIVFEFICGAVNALDPYSAYLTAGQLAEVYSQIDGNFVGLGVEIKPQTGALLVVRVIPNSPAQRNGILTGDSIVAVDHQLVKDCPAERAANLLQGEAGSVVEISVVTPGQPERKLLIPRQRVEVPSIDEARIIDATRGIGYLKMVCFQKNTSREMDEALWRLHREGMKSLIVDVRGNPGGLLVAAVDVAEKFIAQGTIVVTRGRSAQEDFNYTAHQVGVWQVPLVVLIDQDSASAAEIFAGAVRDHHRGTLVGVRSYGKGSVQGIFPLGYANAGVRLTTARFYSPAGHPYHRVGIEPDVLVHRTARPLPGNEAPAASPEDPMLGAALQAAAGALPRR